MNRETFKQQLSELFPAETFTVRWAGSNEAQINIKRELSRLELGHLFSLGAKSIKRSADGLAILFDLDKAFLNFSNDTIINHLK